MRRGKTWPVILVVLGLGGLVVLPADPPKAAGSPQAYRFRVAGEGWGKVEIRGVVVVDGKKRRIEPQKAPYEFRCEAGSVIIGYFEAVTPGKTIKLKVFDSAINKNSPVAMADHSRQVLFSWARPGGGERCVVPGEIQDGCTADVLKRIEAASEGNRERRSS